VSQLGLPSNANRYLRRVLAVLTYLREKRIET